MIDTMVLIRMKINKHLGFHMDQSDKIIIELDYCCIRSGNLFIFEFGIS